MNTDDILKQRGKEYGPFISNAETTQDMYQAALNGDNAIMLKSIHKEAIHMICHKISRIVNGNCNNSDSWDDIAGYAKLVANHLKERNDPIVKFPPKTPMFSDETRNED